MIATPLFGRSGLLNMLTKGDGLISIPAGSEGTRKGNAARVFLL